MRVLSPHRKYTIVIFEEKSQTGVDDRGSIKTVVQQPGLLAEFGMFGLYAEEERIAQEKISFKGVPEGVNPLSTLGVYDTDAQAKANGWDREFHQAVKDKFYKLAALFPNDMLIIEDVPAGAPFSRYDELSSEEIISFVEELGLSAHDVKLYESENLARQEILDRMNEILDASAASEIAVSA